MKKLFYPRIAAVNIRKNARTYVPYLLTCILTTAMYYIMKSLSLNDGLNNVFGSSTVRYTLELGTYVIGIFAFVFLFYTNSFLMKNRKKEFGLYCILGMEKKHLARVIAFESLYVTLLSLSLGLIVGILLDKLMYLIIANILGTEIALGFYVSGDAIFSTILLFGILFFLIFLNSFRIVRFSKPIELLRGGNAGEKEPKAKWLAALVGLVCLGSGYYIAVTVQNPVMAVLLFFIAVILVIAGTYLLFASGSIAFLKLLKRNKRYYYKTPHFIGVSGMIYRMKQNAVGLGNICILSTMVLVMISSTASLMVGTEEMLENRYPYQISVMNFSADDEKNRLTEEITENLLKEENIPTDRKYSCNWLSFSALYDGGDTFEVGMSDTSELSDISNVCMLCFITADDYSKILGTPVKLGKNEVIFCDSVYGEETQKVLFRNAGYENDYFKLFGETYEIKSRTNVFAENGYIAASAAASYGIVVKDHNVIKEIFKKQAEVYSDNSSELYYTVGFDTSLPPEEQTALYEKLKNTLDGRNEETGHCRVECREHERADFRALYGSLFFLGLFLGTLFLMAAVLIIYYKQISEGYDDRGRFEIMQKVGMSAREVKASIHSQVLTVFFLPLLTAGIHVMFAFPMINRILRVLNLTNTALYLICTAVCFLSFTVIYGAVYLITAKAYYRIVRRA